jgi:zinc finger protein
LSSAELGLHVNPGTLGGRFTTVEGILTQIRKDLRSQIFEDEDENDTGGDSLPSKTKSKWDQFFENLGAATRGEKKFTLVLEDPLASSYVQSLTAPDPDPQLLIEDYKRTAEQEEDLGLHDIKTESYEEPAVEKEGEADIDR